eukprot:7514261-Pyramimonas_sp.AAC.1
MLRVAWCVSEPRRPGEVRGPPSRQSRGVGRLGSFRRGKNTHTDAMSHGFPRKDGNTWAVGGADEAPGKMS